MQRPRSLRPKSRVGPGIVRAWFDTVINPLLAWLEHEQQLLAAGNWTWRFRPGTLEAIRSVRSYVDVELNLEQFVQLNPEVQPVIRAHDVLVLRLREDCHRLYEQVRRSERLSQTFREVTSPKILNELGRSVAELFGAYRESDYLNLLAEYIVNGAGELPSHYTTAPLWNRFRQRFLRVLDDPPIRRHRQIMTKTSKALIREGQRLFRLLTDLRLKLSVDHDVPYVASATH